MLERQSWGGALHPKHKPMITDHFYCGIIRIGFKKTLNPFQMKAAMPESVLLVLPISSKTSGHDGLIWYEIFTSDELTEMSGASRDI